MKTLIETLPKIELHVHIEGTLAPERMLMLADQNEVPLPYENLMAVRKAYNFDGQLIPLNDDEQWLSEDLPRTLGRRCGSIRPHATHRP